MENNGSVRSVERALRVLAILSRHDGGMQLRDLARETGLAVSTTHRLLTTLEEDGYVRSHARTWQVGPQAFVVGAAYMRQRNLMATALPTMRSLREMTGETVNLGIIEKQSVIIIGQVEARDNPCAVSRTGEYVPVLNSGIGKALVAGWGERDIGALVKNGGLRAMTDRSLGSLSEVRRNLEQAQREGYATDIEEAQNGVHCVAAAVTDPTGEPLCAISVSGNFRRLSDDRIRQIGPKVRILADEIARHHMLGRRGHPVFA